MLQNRKLGKTLPHLGMACFVSIAILFSAPAHADGSTLYKTTSPDPDVIAISQSLNFPCATCLALISDGGGRRGATSSILDLHVLSSSADVAFPRALTARMESECAACEPAALQIQARGNSEVTTVWAANFEAYSKGRASVLELNIGAARGGYAIDVVPTRLADGSSSKIDAVLKVQGLNNDPTAARIGAYIEAKINPERGVVVVPDDQGPVTVMATADGRMKEIWEKTGTTWSHYYMIDGVRQP